MPRFYCPAPLVTGELLDLPEGPARHVQVLRMQPEGSITLFNGKGGEFEATITAMGRSNVQVKVGARSVVERETPRAVHLAVGMPANERMDWLVEKATELGVASIQPLMTERSVLRLSGERAAKKVAHWQSIAVAACEQSGRNQVPLIHEAMTLPAWLAANTSSAAVRCLLSLHPDSRPISALLTASEPPASIVFLSGPEGGLSAAEENLALQRDFLPIRLGARVLRAETAALAALVALTLTE
jgi:16S rRNA (uracil1498-N3)-methyltransferase